MLPFRTFQFLWANAVIIKCMGEGQIKSIGRWLIYVSVKLYSNLFLIHDMGVMNNISKECSILLIYGKNVLKPHKITNAVPCVESQLRYLPL